MTRACYRLLLLAFPRRIRRQFGDDMLRMFEQQLRGATPGGAARLWADAVGHGTAERFSETRQRRSRMALTAEKIAVLAPIPSASVRMA